MDTQETYSGADAYDTRASSTDTGEIPVVESSSKKGRSSSGGKKGSTSPDLKQEVQETAGQVADQAQETVGKVVEQVRGTASSQLSTQKDRAAESIGSVAQMVRSASEHFQDQDQWTLAQYTDSAAVRIEQISDYLRNRDLREISVQVEHFARRQPTLFLAGAFGLGLVAARFLKSSGQAQQGDVYGGYNRQDYSRSYAGSQTSNSTDFSSYGGQSQSGAEEAGYSPEIEAASVYEGSSYDAEPDAVQTEG